MGKYTDPPSQDCDKEINRILEENNRMLKCKNRRLVHENKRLCRVLHNIKGLAEMCDPNVPDDEH